MTKSLGRCGLEILTAASNGSVSTYFNMPRPAPASLVQDFETSLGHYFSN